MMNDYTSDQLYSFDGVSVDDGGGGLGIGSLDPSYFDGNINQEDYIDLNTQFIQQQQQQTLFDYTQQQQQSQIDYGEYSQQMQQQQQQQQMNPSNSMPNYIQQQQQHQQQISGNNSFQHFVPQSFSVSNQWHHSECVRGGIPPISSSNDDVAAVATVVDGGRMYNTNNNNGINNYTNTNVNQQQQMQNVGAVGGYNTSPDSMPDTDSNTDSPLYLYSKYNQSQTQMQMQNQPKQYYRHNHHHHHHQKVVSPILMSMQNTVANVSPPQNPQMNPFVTQQQQQQQQQQQSQQISPLMMSMQNPTGNVSPPTQNAVQQQQPNILTAQLPPKDPNYVVIGDENEEEEEENEYEINGVINNNFNVNNTFITQTSPPSTLSTVTPTSSTTTTAAAIPALMPTQQMQSQPSLLDEERNVGTLMPMPAADPAAGSMPIPGSDCGGGRPRKQARMAAAHPVVTAAAAVTTRTDVQSSFSLGKLSYTQLCTLSIDSFESYVQDQRRERALTQEEESYVKKIRRTIKNRASAMKSRTKKNQHVMDLEGYVTYLQTLLRKNNISFHEFVPSDSSSANSSNLVSPLASGTSSPPSNVSSTTLLLSSTTSSSSSATPPYSTSTVSSSSSSSSSSTVSPAGTVRFGMNGSKRKAQFMFAGLVFFALMMFFFNGTFASLFGVGSILFAGNSGGNSGGGGLISNNMLSAPSVIGGNADMGVMDGNTPAVIGAQNHVSMHSIVENLRQMFSIGNQSVSDFISTNESSNDYVMNDVTGEKKSQNIYKINKIIEEEEEEKEEMAGEEVEEEERWGEEVEENNDVIVSNNCGNDEISKLGTTNDVIISSDNSPVVPQNVAPAGKIGGYTAGCNSAFPGIEPRTYEAREWSSKENVPYLFCNDVKHYKPAKRFVKIDGGDNEVCQVQGNKSVGIIIPSSSLDGLGDENDDLIELVCTIDEINFIRRNSSVMMSSTPISPNSQSPVMRKTNLPTIVP